MAIIQIKPAKRQGKKVIIGLAGPSGGGKTYTAILLARGLVGPDEPIGVLDTENGRSSLYDKLAGGFFTGELDAPFSPLRYVEAIETFEQAGYKVLIIDSGSHEWEGVGGVLDQVDTSKVKNDLGKWKEPKRDHRRFRDAMIHSKMHIIFCCRAKEKKVPAKDENGKPVVVNVGWSENQDPALLFEMTASLLLLPDGSFEFKKCPAELQPAFYVPDGERLGIANGQQIMEWINQGAPVDHAQVDLERRAREAASGGKDAFAAFWKGLTKKDGARLAPIMDDLKSIALEADKAAAQTDPDQQQAADAGPGTPPPEPFVLNVGGDELPFDDAADLERAFPDELAKVPSAERAVFWDANAPLFDQLRERGLGLMATRLLDLKTKKAA